MDKQEENKELTSIVNYVVCLGLTVERKNQIVEYINSLIEANNTEA